VALERSFASVLPDVASKMLTSCKAEIAGRIARAEKALTLPFSSIDAILTPFAIIVRIFLFGLTVNVHAIRL